MDDKYFELIKTAEAEINNIVDDNPSLLDYQTQLSKMLIGLDDEGRRMLILKAMQLNMQQLTKNLNKLKEKLDETTDGNV